jgi:hypothetical protein
MPASKEGLTDQRLWARNYQCGAHPQSLWRQSASEELLRLPGAVGRDTDSLVGYRGAMSARTKHGHLVRIWLRLAGSKRSKPVTLASVHAYLQADDGFVADFVHLNAEQKLLAMEAAAAALERFRPKAAVPAGRIAWSKSLEWQERVRDAARRLPDDRAIARELGLSVGAAAMARQRFAGRRNRHTARLAA